jgi:hypothetical protein
MKKLRHIISFYFRKSFVKKNEVPYSEKRALIASFAQKYALSTFVETGTFLGDTVEFFRPQFHKLYSIELSKELADKAAARFAGHDNVQIINGDSGVELKKLVKEINGPALYWLDGHYSSEFFMGSEYIVTARGEKDTPVVSELQTLLKDKHRHVILIDDARLFNGNNDYPKIKEIKQMLQQATHPYTLSVERDIIRILPSS